MNQELMTMDFWQDTVIYEGKTFPIGTLACDALNVPADTISKMNEQCEKINLMLGAMNAKQDASALFPMVREAALAMLDILSKTPPFSYIGVKTAGPELSDVADQNLPHLWKAFIQHEFTLWNKDVAFGTQTDLFFVLNPLNWVFLLGMELGQLLKTILKYTIAFLGLFLFLRRCRLCRESAFIGAISYCFCSVMVMWNGWPHSDVMAFGPWLFYFAESMILEYHDKSHIRIGNCIGFTMILYLMLISGMPTYVPFFIYSGFVQLLT